MFFLFYFGLGFFANPGIFRKLQSKFGSSRGRKDHNPQPGSATLNPELQTAGLECDRSGRVYFSTRISYWFKFFERIGYTFIYLSKLKLAYQLSC